MKLNQELINLLANGKIQLHHNGTVEQLNEILKAAFPGDKVKVSNARNYYNALGDGYWQVWYRPSIDLPIFTTEQFYEPDEVGEVLTAEVRELAKELFIAFMYAGQLPAQNSMNKAISTAKEFVRMLDEAE